MAPKKADVAGKKAEAAQDLSPSALELLLPLWDDALQDSSVPGVLLAAQQRLGDPGSNYAMTAPSMKVQQTPCTVAQASCSSRFQPKLQVMKTPLAQQCCWICKMLSQPGSGQQSSWRVFQTSPCMWQTRCQQQTINHLLGSCFLATPRSAGFVHASTLFKISG